MGKLVLYICFWLLIPAFSSQASERHALIIGNSDYEIFGLENARNNAIDMAAQLRSMDYKIYSSAPLFDLDRISMEQSITSFARSLPRGASAVFYYAGHGIATNNDNYLLPVNNKLELQLQIQDSAIGLRSIVEQLRANNSDGVNVLLLDACRNPLARNFLDVKRCLQKIKNVPRDVFIGYATESRKITTAGIGVEYGIYTSELLESMAKKPHLSIEVLHDEVASRVYEKTKGMQFPVSEDMVYGKWCFDECQPDATDTNGAMQSVKATDTFNFELITAKQYWLNAGCGVLQIAVAILAAQNGSTYTPGADQCQMP